MSLDLRKRRVHFYEISMSSFTRSDGVKNPSICSIQSLLQCFTAMNVNKPFDIRRTNRVSTTLVDWNYDPVNGYYELLVNKADAGLSDIALRDLESKSLRKAGKKKIEGIESSSHILIRPNVNTSSVTVLMTMGAGVAIADIASLLRLLGKSASKIPANRNLFYFDHPSGEKDGNGNAVKYRVSYTFHDYAYKGETLSTALSSGEFESMELIAHGQTQFDAGGNLQIESRSVMVKAMLPKTVTGATLKNGIRYYRSQPDGAAFDTAKIHYKSPSGKPSVATLAVQDLDAVFTRNEMIHFDTDVEAQQGSLSQTVLQKMRPLLIALPQV